MGRPSGRLDALTGMRFAAALGVCICHIAEYHHTVGVAGHALDFGRFGVDFFFILSGFVLAWSWSPTRSTARFYWLRMARIWPIHLVVLALLLPLRIGGPPLEPLMELLDIFLLVQWFPLTDHHAMTLNPATWTLSVELAFYLILPLVLPRLTRLDTRRVLLLVSVFWLAGASWTVGAEHVLHIRSPWWMAINPVLWLPEFFLGVALALVLQRRGALTTRTALWVGSFGCAIILLDMWLYCAARMQWVDGRFLPPWAFLVDIPFVFIILATASLEMRDKIRCPRWLVILGEWSFALYLIHRHGIIYPLAPRLEALPFWAESAVMLCAMITASGVLYEFVEKPLERWVRSKGPAR